MTRRVDPQLLFGISLFAGLVLAAPALHGALEGDVDIVVAGIRLLVSIAFAWCAVYAITWLFVTFAMQADVSPAPRDDDSLRRRATDQPLALPEGPSE